MIQINSHYITTTIQNDIHTNPITGSNGQGTPCPHCTACLQRPHCRRSGRGPHQPGHAHPRRRRLRACVRARDAAPCSLAAPACALAGPRPAASQHARSRRPRPTTSRRPWRIGPARPRGRQGPRPCGPWAGRRRRPALDLEFQVRRSGGEKQENGARDFFWEIRG